jgi:hypothetical protein
MTLTKQPHYPTHPSDLPAAVTGLLVETIPALRANVAALEALSRERAARVDALEAENADLREKLDFTVWECPHCADIFFEDARTARRDHWRDCEGHPAHAEIAAMRRALQVLLAKVDNHPAADIPDGIVSCRYVPVTPGEAAVWRALACPSSVGVGGER